MGSNICCQKPQSLSVTCSTWLKDSHGLFDYETTQVASKTFTVRTAAKLVLTNQGVQAESKDQQAGREGKSSKGLVSVGMIRQQYWVYSLASTVSSEEELWMVLRDYIDEGGYPGYRLSEGLIIKMGRCRYLVKQLVTSEEMVDKSFDNTYMDHNENNVSDSCDKNIINEKMNQELNNTKKIDEKACRICLLDENTPENLLIESPCLCTGSVRFLHVDCLKYWLKSKVSEKRTEYAVTYMWKDFECEVCKSKYPNKFSLPNGECFDIFKIDKPKSSYMVLEADTKSTAGIKITHLIFLGKKKSLKIGRGHDADVRVSDISVSRSHAEIKEINGEFYISDLKSKFGTLILAQRPINVKPCHMLSLQSGRSHLRIELVLPSYCGCCWESVKNVGAPATEQEIEEMLEFGRLQSDLADPLEPESCINERTVTAQQPNASPSAAHNEPNLPDPGRFMAPRLFDESNENLRNMEPPLNDMNQELEMESVSVQPAEIRADPNSVVEAGEQRDAPRDNYQSMVVQPTVVAPMSFVGNLELGYRSANNNANLN